MAAQPHPSTNRKPDTRKGGAKPPTPAHPSAKPSMGNNCPSGSY